MPSWSQGMLTQATGGTWQGKLQTAVRGFAIDSRTLRPGELFVALKGQATDGHHFLGQALEQRAAAALVEAPRPLDLPQLIVPDAAEALRHLAAAHRQTFTAPVIGITGSCGKTSTKELLSLLLGENGLKTAGNRNNLLGVPLTLLELDVARHRWAVVEAGISEPGEMAQLAAMIRPDQALITMIGAAHLEGLGHEFGVAREKTQLYAHLNPRGHAWYHVDCLQYPGFREARGAQILTPEPVAAYALPMGAQCWGYTLQAHPSRLGAWQMGLQPPGASVPLPFTLPPMSHGMARNALLALAVALYLGEDPDDLQARLDTWRGGDQRAEWREVAGRMVYVDCYNANPSSMRDALEAFVRRFPQAPRTFVLGGMKELGPRGADWHARIAGEVPAQPGDTVIFVGAESADYARFWPADTTGVEPARVVNTEAALGKVLASEGPVFLKGSRAYRLERLLEGLAQAGQWGEEDAGC